MEEICFENFNISKNNIISVELAKGTKVYFDNESKHNILAYHGKANKIQTPTPQKKIFQNFTHSFSKLNPSDLGHPQHTILVGFLHLAHLIRLNE